MTDEMERDFHTTHLHKIIDVQRCNTSRGLLDSISVCAISEGGRHSADCGRYETVLEIARKCPAGLYDQVAVRIVSVRGAVGSRDYRMWF